MRAMTLPAWIVLWRSCSFWSSWALEFGPVDTLWPVRNIPYAGWPFRAIALSGPVLGTRSLGWWSWRGLMCKRRVKRLAQTHAADWTVWAGAVMGNWWPLWRVSRATPNSGWWLSRPPGGPTGSGTRTPARHSRRPISPDPKKKTKKTSQSPTLVIVQLKRN